MLNFGITWRHIQKRNMLELVNDMSSFIKIELENAARDKGEIGNVRGLGTAIAFDLQNSDKAGSMQRWLLQRGIVVARVGPVSLGLRPAIILGPVQIAALRDAVRGFHPNHDDKF